ncbi:MAG: hypothetical protein JST54_16915 [Deltaproteobacteria bacterium]|nr:hypothetical protein [Deltaproteobacteria bacterium]
MRRPVLLLLALLCGCSRSFDAPVASQPGTLYGRVVVQRSASGELEPAGGARVGLLGSSLATTCGSDGRFLLSGITITDGTLLVEFDSDGDGQIDRRSALSLADLHAGPGLQIDTGDIVVARPATVKGRVRRGDALDSPGGNGGAVVFVPQGPFTVTTADDGSFILAGLPAGSITLSVFLTGYEPVTLGALALGAGQLFTVDDIILTPHQGPPGTGSLSVHVELNPAADKSGTKLHLTGAGSLPPDATTDSNGDGRFDGIAEGVYAVAVHHDGYVDAPIPNVVVLAGELTAVQTTLGTTPLPTSGTDAGPNGGDGGNITPDGTLYVLASDPSTADQNAIFGARVTFTLDVSATSATDPANVSVTADGSNQLISGTLSYDATSRTITLTYDTPLALDTGYTLSVQNVLGTDGANPTSVVPFTLHFTPHAIRWRLFSDVSGNVSVDATNLDTTPVIAWTPGGVHVISRQRGAAACASDSNAMDYGRFYPLDVTDAGLVPTDPSGCVSDQFTQGDDPIAGHHHLAQAGGNLYALLGNDRGPTTYDLYEYAGGTWLQRFPNGSQDVYGELSDGTGLFIVILTDASNGEVSLQPFDPSAGTLDPAINLAFTNASVSATTWVRAAGSARDFFVGAVDRDPAGGSNNQVVQVLQRDTGAYPAVGSTSPVPTISDFFLFEADGVPFVLQNENGSTAQLYSTGSVPAGSAADFSAIGNALPADEYLAAAQLGRTIFVVTASGNIALHHLPLAASQDDPWTADPGPNGGAIAERPECINTAPSIAAGQTDLWVAWSQGCPLGDGGLAFTTVVREAY